MSSICRIQELSDSSDIVMDVMKVEIFSLLARSSTNHLDVENVHI